MISCNNCDKSYPIGSSKAVNEFFNKNKSQHDIRDPTAYNKRCRECGVDFAESIWGETEKSKDQRQKYDKHNLDYVVDDNEEIEQEDISSSEEDIETLSDSESAVRTSPIKTRIARNPTQRFKFAKNMLPTSKPLTFGEPIVYSKLPSIKIVESQLNTAARSKNHLAKLKKLTQSVEPLVEDKSVSQDVKKITVRPQRMFEIPNIQKMYDADLIMAIQHVSFDKARAALDKNSGNIVKALKDLGYEHDNETCSSKAYDLVYNVESIIDRKDNEFLIKWEGYDEPTWEPLEHLSCNEKIIEFLESRE